MIYTCETCGKQYNHKGDYEKHTTKRQKTCARPTEQILMERLKALETALVAGGHLNPELIEKTDMTYPPSRAEIAAQGILDYAAYIQEWLTQKGMRPLAAGMAAARQHRVLDDIIAKYHMYDLMKRLPANAKTEPKQRLIEQYFLGNFTNPGGENIPATAPENVARVVPAEPAAPAIEPPPAVWVNPAQIIDHVPIVTADGTRLRNMFERFEQSMRDNSGITGEKAKDDIIALFVLRALQSRIESGKINVLDIDAHPYPRQFITEENIQYALMKNLAKLPKESLMVELGRIWRMVLAKHPVTSALYRSDKFLNLKDDSLLASIVSELSAFDMENCDRDVLSDVYQHFIHKQFNGDKGSKLGQHFTPIHIVRFILRDVLPFMNSNQRMIDPFMGTAGFIVEAYRALSTVRNDSPAEYLFGTEIDNDVYICSVANVMMATGQICPGLESRSAFTQTANVRRYDLILTNPPFGMSFSNAEAYNKTLWFNHAKIKNGNLICLQYLMHILAEGGMCSFVWPFGSECYSSNEKMVSVRRRLFDEFEVIRVVMLPNGTFEHAGVATVIITFRKPYAGQKPEKRLRAYQYADGAKTYTELVQLCDASAEQLAARQYSLNPKDYEISAELDNKVGFEWKKMGDVIDFKNGSQFVKDSIIDGPYPVVGGGSKPMGFHNKNNTPANTILVSKDGEYAGYVSMYNVDVFATNHCIRAYPKIHNGYVYYYMKYIIQGQIYDLQRGSAQPGIKSTQIAALNIPVPSPERQTEIADIIKKLEQGIRATEEAINSTEFELECLSQQLFKFPEGEYEIKKLGEITTFIPSTKFKTSEGLLEGEFRFYASSQDKVLYTNAPHIRNLLCIILGNGGAFNIHIDSNFTPSKHVTALHPNDQNIVAKYLYYYIRANKHLLSDLFNGVAIKWMNRVSISNIEIVLVNREKQLEIVSQFDAIVADIKALEAIRDRKIAFLKDHAKFLFG